MRFVVGMLACLGVGAVTVALADPPADPAQSTSTSASTPATSTPAASSAATSTAAAATTHTTSLKEEFTPEENHFVQEGFHAEMHRGTKVFCRYEDVSGSRVVRQKMCGTVQELKATEESSQAAAAQAARMQQNRPVN
jgi:hypothetical protein